MSHAGSTKSLFKYSPVSPCLLDVLPLLLQRLSLSEQFKPGFMKRFRSGSSVSVLTELQLQQQQPHQLWTSILTFVCLAGGAAGDAGGHPGCGVFCDEEPRWNKWVWTRISPRDAIPAVWQSSSDGPGKSKHFVIPVPCFVHGLSGIAVLSSYTFGSFTVMKMRNYWGIEEPE